VLAHKFEKSKKNVRVYIKETANQNIIGRLENLKGKDEKWHFVSPLADLFEYQLTHLTQLTDRLIKLLTSSHLS